MILDMTPILDAETDRIPFSFTYTPGEDSVVSALFPDIAFSSPIKCSGFVSDMAGYMSLHADVSLVYDTVCARCAEPVTGKLAFSFEKDIADSSVSRDNDDYLFIENQRLDLVDPLEEQLLLELPSKTLCREDCKGLCGRCGQNLNFGDCDCKKHEVDPRLAVLKTLLDK